MLLYPDLTPGVPPRLLAAPWPAPVPGEAAGGAGPGGGRQDLGAPQSAARHRRALGGGARRRRGVPAGAAPGQPRPAQPAQGRAGRAARSDIHIYLLKRQSYISETSTLFIFILTI